MQAVRWDASAHIALHPVGGIDFHDKAKQLAFRRFRPCTKAASEHHRFAYILPASGRHEVRQILPFCRLPYSAYECGDPKNTKPRHAASSTMIVVARQIAIHNGPVAKVIDKAAKIPRAIATGSSTRN